MYAVGITVTFDFTGSSRQNLLDMAWGNSEIILLQPKMGLAFLPMTK